MATTTTASATKAAAIHERPAWTASGLLGAAGLIILLAGATALITVACVQDPDNPDLFMVLGGSLAICVAAIGVTGLVVVQPGSTRVLVFFGNYIGTVSRPGFWLTAPLASRQLVSVRVRNFETKELKVNDSDGNPIMVAAIVVWRVEDTAQASFAVEDYQQFVAVQSEAALRHVVMSRPYDGPDGAVTLRGATAEVSSELAQEVAERVNVAGVAIIEVRISKLSYAPEIAEAMLRRQQAGAIIAARERIVEGAVTVVRQALTQLEADGTVTLDDERRAAMVSNLLVVLTADQPASPVINTGSLYT
ncbi:MAG: SPFH domain-containing protein [Bifidobacteriaceae bacterium]|nr:SPFH domain-containing protein [Bifidobacteriaceae bacterium]